MKILIWSQYFWPENFRINDLAASLQQSGMQVTVLTGKPNYPDGTVFPGYKADGILRERYLGVQVVRLPLVPRGNGTPLRLAFNYLSFILSSYILAPFILRRCKYDVIFVYALSPLLQALPAVLIARLKRAPLVIWVQDLWPESLTAIGLTEKRWVVRVMEALVRYIYRKANFILIQSEGFREPVGRLANDPKKILYFPNTAPLAPDCCITNSEVISQLQSCFSVVFAGNVGKAQSLETILDAADLLRMKRNIRIFIIGSGSREAWLAKEIDRRKLPNIVLIGRLPYASMQAILEAASALLVTLVASPALSQTIPSKLQAYLAAGRPVIASLNGEGATIVRAARAGFACPAEDAEALTAAMLKLYSLSPSQRNLLGSNGRSYFEEHFESSKSLKKIVELFLSISGQGAEESR